MSSSGLDGPDAAAPTPAEPTLTTRATLTAAAAAVRLVGRIAVQLVTLPAITRGLGTTGFGVYSVVNQTAGYSGMADLRAAGTLKFLLATNPDRFDDVKRRRLVGASLVVWAGTLPLAAAIGVGLAFVLDDRLVSEGFSSGTVRTALLALAGAVVIDRGLSVSAAVVRGTNLDYRTAVVDVAATAIGGITTAIVALRTESLILVCASSFVAVLLTNAGQFVIAKRSVPWYGVAWPRRQDVVELLGTSGWLILGEAAAVLLFGTELVVVGAIAGADGAAVYAATTLAIRVATPPLAQLLTASAPGMALVAARGEWERFHTVRRETIAVAIGTGTVFGCGVALLNRPFVALFTDESLYGGAALTAAAAVTGLVTAILRADSTFVDVMGAYRRRASLTAVVAVVTALASGVGAHISLTAVAVTHLLGRTVLALGLTKEMTKASGIQFSGEGAWLAKRVIPACVLITLTAAAGSQFSNLALPVLTAAGLACTAVSAAVVWRVLLDAHDRSLLRARIEVILRPVRRRRDGLRDESA